jgi:hypothetical protein
MLLPLPKSIDTQPLVPLVAAHPFAVLSKALQESKVVLNIPLELATNGLGALLAVIAGVAIVLALALLFKLFTVALVSILTVKPLVNTSSPVVGIPSKVPSFHTLVEEKLPPPEISHLTAIR